MRHGVTLMLIRQLKLTIWILRLCKSADRTYVEYMIQDYDKPMGVATYKTATDMPERLRNALPSQEALVKLIEGK